MKKVLLVLIKIISRLRINLFLYKVLDLLHLNKAIVVSDGMEKQAYSYLNSLNPYHEDTTCCCSHSLNPVYDLHIIVPAYQQEQYISECIDSILSQKTQYSYYLTIVDDGSTDGTAALLDKYKNWDNVSIIRQSNQGLSAARNRGMETILGKYLMFVDSDDLLCPDAIDRLMKEAFEQDADVVEGSYLVFNDKGIVRTNKCSHYVGGQHEWKGRLSGYAWGKVYKSTLFVRFQFPKGLWFEDTIMLYLIYSQCRKIVTIAPDVYQYRANDKGISAVSVGKKKVLDTLWINSLLLKESLGEKVAKNDELLPIYLGQVQIDFQRIVSLLDYKTCKASFIWHQYLLNTYFGGINDSSELYRCLKNGNFWGYVLLCL